MVAIKEKGPAKQVTKAWLLSHRLRLFVPPTLKQRLGPLIGSS